MWCPWRTTDLTLFTEMTRWNKELFLLLCMVLLCFHVFLLSMFSIKFDQIRTPGEDGMILRIVKKSVIFDLFFDALDEAVT